MDSSKEAGFAVKHRRQMLRMTIAEAAALGAISTTTWTNVEAGKPVTQDTVIGVAQALAWRQDWLERILAGEPPVLTIEPEPASTLQSRADAWDQQQGQTMKEWRESVESRLANLERAVELLVVLNTHVPQKPIPEHPLEEIERYANLPMGMAADKGQVEGTPKNVRKTRPRNK